MKKYIGFIPIFVILILSFCVVFWSKDKFMISMGDFSFPQDRIREFYKMINTWDWTFIGGPTFMPILALPIPYGIYLALTHLLHISPVHSQIFLNYFLLSSLGLSMYFLVIQLTQNRIRHAAGLLSALFFMFNPWGAINFTMFIPFITFIPLILGLYIKGLRGDKKIKYAVSISIIWFFVSSFSLWNIRGFMFQWMILILYLIFFSFQNPKKIRHALIFTCILFILYFFMNFYWLLLFCMNIIKSVSGSAEVYDILNYTRMDSFRVNSSTMSYVLRLLDNWSLTANFKGAYYFPWLAYFQNPFLIFLGFLPFVTSLISLFYIIKNKLKQHSDFLFFFFLLLFGLFVSMGKNNTLTMWCADHLPLFSTLFSSPSYLGGIFIAISYSVLIGYSFMFIYQKIKKTYIQAGTFLLYFVIIIIYGYPVLSGTFIPSGSKVLGAGRYSLPPYTVDLAQKISQDKLNYRIFSLPYSIIGYFAYNWPQGGFSGPDPLINMLSKPQIIGTGISIQLADMTTKNIDKTSFFRLNSLLNVKYIMNKKDANLLHIKNNSWYIVPSQTFLDSLYQNSKNISSYGQIDLIKIPDELFLPKLHTPLNIVLGNKLTDLTQIVSQKNYQTRTAIYLKNQNLNKSPPIINSKKTILEYRIINPTKYRVKVHNAEGVFPLIMSEGYDEKWNVYLTKNISTPKNNLNTIQGTIQNDNLSSGPFYETWFEKPAVEDIDHLMVNGYANSWTIDTNKVCKEEFCHKNADGSYDFEFVIEFYSQRLYYLGIVISIITLSGCIGYLVILSFRATHKSGKGTEESFSHKHEKY